MNLNVILSPPNTREVRDYNKADRKNIQRSTCNWAVLFIKLTINEGVELIFNKLINTIIPINKIKFKYG